MATTKTTENRVDDLEECIDQINIAADETAGNLAMAAKKTGENTSEIDDARDALEQHGLALVGAAERFQDAETRIKKLEKEYAYLQLELNRAIGLLGHLIKSNH